MSLSDVLNGMGEAPTRWTGQVVELLDATHVKVAIGSKVRTCIVPSAYSWVNVGQDVVVLYDGNLASIDGIAGAAAGGGLAPGDLVAFAGQVAKIPRGRLICAGQAVSRAAYPALFAAIGTTWGAGDGSTTFNLPPGGLMFVGYKSGDALFGAVANQGGSRDAVVVSHTHSTSSTRVFKSSSGIDDEEVANGSGFTLSFDWDVTTGAASSGVSGTNRNLPPYGVVCMTIQT